MDLVWLVAAFSAGIIAKAVRLPTMVGYLAAGLVLALFGVESDTLIQAVADFGSNPLVVHGRITYKPSQFVRKASCRCWCPPLSHKHSGFHSGVVCTPITSSSSRTDCRWP